MNVQCGGDLKAQANMETLTTPNYPNPYPNGLECVWTIEAPEGQLVTLDVSFFKVFFKFSCWKMPSHLIEEIWKNRNSLCML